MINDDINTITTNPIFVDNHVANENSRIRENGAEPSQDDEPSQLLPPPSHPHTNENATPRETLASDPTIDQDPNKRPKFNNSTQHRHWNFTFNNYAQTDYDQIKTALMTDQTLDVKSRKVVSCIVGKESGKTGTPHLQAYIHFKKVKRQSEVFGFFGYDPPYFHLKEQDLKRSPPIALFQYCMKDND